MTDYNVWRLRDDRASLDGRWYTDLTALKLPAQNRDAPRKLSYIDARKVMEDVSIGILVVVRELLSDGKTPGPIVGYNVWVDEKNRWTDCIRLSNVHFITQDSDAPIPLTYMQAERLYEYYTDQGIECTICEIGSDYSNRTIGNLLPSQRNESNVSEEAKQSSDPAVPETVEQVTPVINYDIYNGFIHRSPMYVSRSGEPQYDTKPKVKDQYTGLEVDSQAMKRLLGKK